MLVIPIPDYSIITVHTVSKVRGTIIIRNVQECSGSQSVCLPGQVELVNPSCLVTEWSLWSPCSVSCGSGLKVSKGRSKSCKIITYFLADDCGVTVCKRSLNPSQFWNTIFLFFLECTAFGSNSRVISYQAKTSSAMKKIDFVQTL